MIIDEKDKALLALLSANGRESTAELARKLKLSRSTVKDRIARLEKRGIINGFTVRFSEAYDVGQIKAHVLISTDTKKTAEVVRALRQVGDLKSLYAVNGIYDMIAMISADSTQTLDKALDQIGNTEGVETTVSSIIPSTKLAR